MWLVIVKRAGLRRCHCFGPPCRSPWLKTRVDQMTDTNYTYVAFPVTVDFKSFTVGHMSCVNRLVVIKKPSHYYFCNIFVFSWPVLVVFSQLRSRMINERMLNKICHIRLNCGACMWGGRFLVGLCAGHFWLQRLKTVKIPSTETEDIVKINVAQFFGDTKYARAWRRWWRAICRNVTATTTRLSRSTRNVRGSRPNDK